MRYHLKEKKRQIRKYSNLYESIMKQRINELFSVYEILLRYYPIVQLI